MSDDGSHSNESSDTGSDDDEPGGGTDDEPGGGTDDEPPSGGTDDEPPSGGTDDEPPGGGADNGSSANGSGGDAVIDWRSTIIVEANVTHVIGSTLDLVAVESALLEASGLDADSVAVLGSESFESRDVAATHRVTRVWVEVTLPFVADDGEELGGDEREVVARALYDAFARGFAGDSQSSAFTALYRALSAGQRVTVALRLWVDGVAWLPEPTGPSITLTISAGDVAPFQVFAITVATLWITCFAGCGLYNKYCNSRQPKHFWHGLPKPKALLEAVSTLQP